MQGIYIEVSDGHNVVEGCTVHDTTPRFRFAWRYALLAAVWLVLLAAFGYVMGWL